MRLRYQMSTDCGSVRFKLYAVMGTICIYSSIIYYLRDYIVREIYQTLNGFKSVWMFLDLERISFFGIPNVLQLCIIFERGSKIWTVVIILFLLMEQQFWFCQNFQ